MGGDAGQPRARTTDGTIARPTDAQYRALRYWAGNTLDQGFAYVQTRGPAPRVLDRTVTLMADRGWWSWTASGFLVWDAGRRAAGLPGTGRDDFCGTCKARPGERCRYGADVHRDIVHVDRVPPPAVPVEVTRDIIVGALAHAGVRPGDPVGLITAT